MAGEIIWTDAIETLIKGLGEKALSMAWLHNRSEKFYSYRNNYLAIPTIVLSTITGVGTASWGSEPNINFVMAGFSIIVSIISTLNSYFAFAKKAEAHRITSVSYSKLYLQISIELSLPRKKRMNVKDFLKTVSEQVQRLNEISPNVPDTIINDYNLKFKDEPRTISRPEITNGLVDIKIYNDMTDAPPTTPINITIPADSSNTIIQSPTDTVVSASNAVGRCLASSVLPTPTKLPAPSPAPAKHWR